MGEVMKWKRVVEKCEPFATSMPSISRPSGTRGGRALIEMLMALPTTGAGGPIGRASERTQRPRRERQKRPRLRPITCGNGGGREEGRKEGGPISRIGRRGRKGIPCMIRSRSGRQKKQKKGAIKTTAAAEYLGHSPKHVLTKHNFLTAPLQVVHVSHRPGKPSKMNLRSKHDCTLSVDRPIRITR